MKTYLKPYTLTTLRKHRPEEETFTQDSITNDPEAHSDYKNYMETVYFWDIGSKLDSSLSSLKNSKTNTHNTILKGLPQHTKNNSITRPSRCNENHTTYNHDRQYNITNCFPTMAAISNEHAHTTSTPRSITPSISKKRKKKTAITRPSTANNNKTNTGDKVIK